MKIELDYDLLVFLCGESPPGSLVLLQIKYAGTEESIICVVGNEKDLLVSKWTLEEQDFGMWPTNEAGFTEMLYSC